MQTRKFIEVKKDPKEPMDQLIAELNKAEMKYRHVPLDEFRDRILPKSDFVWAKDTERVKSLLKDAIDRDLVLIRRMLLSHNIMEPTTTVRLNRSGTRRQPTTTPSGSRLEPIEIPGVSLSEYVIQERSEDWR